MCRLFGFRSIIPTEFGGLGSDPRTQLATYEAAAAGNVSLALILTQHDAAAEVLKAGSAESIAPEILGQCGRGKALLPVGISQITTSRRHVSRVGGASRVGGEAAMRATRDGETFILDGVMPWVTSAREADHIVTAAVLPDGSQLLASVPTDDDGICVAEPMELLALQSSPTQRLLREAAFFLVWSAPPAVQTETIRRFWRSGGN